MRGQQTGLTAEVSVTTELVVERLRRSSWLLLVGAVLETAVPVLEFQKSGASQGTLITALCAVILWVACAFQWRAYRAALNDQA